jgi:hypothetical protein
MLAAALATLADSAGVADEAVMVDASRDEKANFVSVASNRIIGLRNASVSLGPCGGPAVQKFTALDTFSTWMAACAGWVAEPPWPRA